MSFALYPVKIEVAEYDLLVNPKTPGIGLTAWVALTKQKNDFKMFAIFTNNPASSGLGLTILRRIIEQHGGRIFEDGRYGHGARFNIILPVVV